MASELDAMIAAIDAAGGDPEAKLVAFLRVGFETHADRANRRIMSMAAAA